MDYHVVLFHLLYLSIYILVENVTIFTSTAGVICNTTESPNKGMWLMTNHVPQSGVNPPQADAEA